MRKVVVVEWMTLDGVVQAPGHPEEDRDGGFEHGGWHLPYFDDLARAWVVQGYAEAGGFLFGRRTYENSRATGRTHRGAGHRRAAELEAEVRGLAHADRTLGWQNSTLLTGDVPQACSR